MSSPNNRFIFRLADPQDNLNILDILEEEAFSGIISLKYTRRPDALLSFSAEGEEVQIVVCWDQQENCIAGFGALAIRKVFIDGKEKRVGYLFSLRASKKYQRNFHLIHYAYNYMHDMVKQKKIDLLVTTILEKNIYARHLLEKERAIMPNYIPYGNYEVFAIKSEKKKRLPLRGYTFSQAQKADFVEIISFIKEQGKKYQFFPGLRTSDITAGKFPGLKPDDFYVIRNKQGQIKAAGAAWDQQNYKQYIVQGYQGILKFLYPVSSLFPIFGFPKLPKKESTLNFYTVSFWASKNKAPRIFMYFLDKLSEANRDYPFYLIGMHNKNPMCQAILKKPHIRYASKIYLVDWNKENDPLKQLNPKYLPYLECGML